ncbi:hypothetical protein SNEBB_008254 [Seison nebaliae]|nr:hypothetical protein SNEBB_008254 [Seison nebaliae]
MQNDDEDDVIKLFNICDVDSSGYIDMEEFLSMYQEQLTSSNHLDEIDREFAQEIFAELDVDGDGQINLKEFRHGFASIFSTVDTKTDDTHNKNDSLCRSSGYYSESGTNGPRSTKEINRPSILQTNLFDDTKVSHQEIQQIEEFLSPEDQGLIYDFHMELTERDLPEMVQKYEETILSIVQDIRSYKTDLLRLENDYEKTKKENDYLTQYVDVEVSNRVKELTNDIKDNETKAVELKFKKIQKRLSLEITDLKTNLSISTKTERDLRKENKQQRQKIERLQDEIESLRNKNSILQKELSETQTALTLLRSDMDRIRNARQENQESISIRKQEMSKLMLDCTHYTHQIQVLELANKKLADTNQQLRTVIGSSLPSRRKNITMNKNAVEYFRTMSEKPSKRNDVKMNTLTFTKLNDKDDLDSGISTIRDESILLEEDLKRTEKKNSVGVEGKKDIVQLEHKHTEVKSTSPENKGSRKKSGALYNTIMKHLSFSHSKDHSTSNDEENSTKIEEKKKSPIIKKKTMKARRRMFKECSGDSSNNSISSSSSFRSSNSSNSKHFYYGRKRNLSKSIKRKVVQQMSITVLQQVKLNNPIFKIIIIGDPSVGKSSFIHKLCWNKDNCKNVDMELYRMKMDTVDLSFVCQIWDTAGQERFGSLSKTFYRKTNGILIMYDVTDNTSFNNVQNWMIECHEMLGEGIPTVVCGSKYDLKEKQQVKSENIDELLHKYPNVEHIKFSNKTGNNVREVISILANQIIANYDPLTTTTINLTMDERSKIFENDYDVTSYTNIIKLDHVHPTSNSNPFARKGATCC